MSSKTILITGANSGIGKAAAKQFAQLGHTVIMGCRNRSRGEAALQEIKDEIPDADIALMTIDLSSQESIHTFVKEFKENYDQLHVLINNAAKFDIWEKEAQMTAEGYESVWATNHLGQVLLTMLLMDTVKKSTPATVINVASQGLMTYPFLKLDFEGIEKGNPRKREGKFSVQWSYYHTKLAQIVFTFELAEQLKGTGVTANIIRVGNVRFSDERLTQMGVPKILRRIYSLKGSLAMTPDKMAETYVYCALHPDMEDITGTYISAKNKPVKANRSAYDKETWKKLWEISMKQVGLE